MNKSNLPEPVEALILILLTFAGLILFTATLVGFFIDSQDIKSNSTTVSIIFMLGKLLVLCLPVYYAYKKEYSIKKLFKLKAVSKEIVVISLIMGISLIIITDEIQRVVDLIVPMPESMKEILAAPKDAQGMEWFLLFVASVLIIPLTDEGLFRGFLQVSLEAKGDPVRAVILTSVSWALVHISPYLAIPIFVMGVFLGYMAWKTGSIIPGIIIQSLSGFIAVNLLDSGLESSIYSWYLWNGHVSPFILIAAIGGLYYSIRVIESNQH